MNELTADVIIVGFGGSGAVAAIEAHDAGASVIVIEKTNEGGGSTRESAGSLRLIADVEKATSHFEALSMGGTPRAALQAFASGAAEIVDWITSHGGIVDMKASSKETTTFPNGTPTTGFPIFKDAEGVGGRVRVKVEPGSGIGHGAALWQVLERNVHERGIRVIYDTRAKQLLTNSNREVTGVVATTASGELTLKARRAVILTCGGFAWNPEMLRQFVGIQMPALSPPNRNTGDGIKMAQEIGADLWHMSEVAASYGYKVPGFEAAYFAKLRTTRFFIVDRKAKRFVNETGVEGHSGFIAQGMLDPCEGEPQRLPSYIIFDEEARKDGPIVTTSKRSYNQRFPWSQDNGDEVKKGWIKSANNIRDLATQLGLSPDQLEKTAAKYNNSCRADDDDLGREAKRMGPVVTPPFYGIALADPRDEVKAGEGGHSHDSDHAEQQPEIEIKQMGIAAAEPGIDDPAHCLRHDQCGGGGGDQGDAGPHHSPAIRSDKAHNAP